uniref:Ovule protein n=1 Tax=Caenorhabditis tropicalis TaxID=1561998 RepID=A0A1I7TQE5_9PELO
MDAPSLAKPATIVSGFGVDEILKDTQKEQEKLGMKNVDSSPEVGGGGVIDSSTSHESSSPDVVMGREHIHDPEHGNDDVINRFEKTQKFGEGREDVEIGGNSEFSSPKSKWNSEVINGEGGEFKKGYAPTEIVWSPSVMSNGYNGGVRRPVGRFLIPPLDSEISGRDDGMNVPLKFKHL